AHVSRKTPRPAALLSDSQCQTAMRNRPRRSSAPRLAVVFPAWPAGFCPFGKAEGAERRVAPGTKHAWRGVPADVRVPLALGEGDAAPFGAPHGVGRPAGSRFRLTARFQRCRWSWPSPGSERIAWSRCAPGRIPEPLGPRACKARRRKRRTPLRLQMPLEAPSSERGWRTICSGTLIAASGKALRCCEQTPEVVQRF